MGMRRETPRRDVAVVIVNWKQHALTERCIRSVLDGSVLPSTVVVVDNETLDFSTSFMQGNIPADPDLPQIIRICSRINRGYAGGVNLGIEAALQLQPDCVVLINNDVVVDPGCLEKLCDTWQKFDAAIVGGRCLNELRDRDVGFARRWPASLWGQGEVATRNAREPVSADIVDGALWLVSRDCLEATMELRGFYLDPLYFLYWEDADLCMFARHIGMRCMFDPLATARHDLAASSGGANNVRGLYYQSRNLILFTFRWSSPVGILIYMPIAILNRLAAIVKHLVNQRFRQVWAVIYGVWHGMRGVRWK